MGAKLRLLAWALVLLAVAHPALGSIALDALRIAFAMAAAAVVAVIGWALTNVSLTLTAMSVLLVLRAFPGIVRWLGRAWDSSIDAILPVKAPAKA